MKYFKNAIGAGPSLFVLLATPYFLFISYDRIPSALAECGPISTNFVEILLAEPSSDNCNPCVTTNNADRVQVKSGDNWLCGFTGSVDVTIPNTLGCTTCSLQWRLFCYASPNEECPGSP